MQSVSQSFVLVIEYMFYNRIAILAGFVKQIGDILRLKNWVRGPCRCKEGASPTRQPPGNLGQARTWKASAPRFCWLEIATLASLVRNDTR